MRLTPKQHQQIRQTRDALLGEHDRDYTVKLFGSRILDDAKGGDIDLYITLPKEAPAPAQLIARIAARLERQFQGRKIDILLSAPNLTKLPIHQIAEQEGLPL